MSVPVYRQPQRWQYWKQFSVYLGASQTISGKRTNQNASTIINKSEISWMIRLWWWIIPILLSPILWELCVWESARVLSDERVCHRRASYHQRAPMYPTNRPHHTPLLNHPTPKGCSHNHKTTTAQTAVRPNHYLAEVAKSCQSKP